MEFLDLSPIRRIAGTVNLPGSKSISNRVLLLAALARGTTVVRDALDADDTRVMLAAIGKLGMRADQQGAAGIRIEGCAGTLPSRGAELFLGNAGTAFRPLTAVLALSAAAAWAGLKLVY